MSKLIEYDETARRAMEAEAIRPSGGRGAPTSKSQRKKRYVARAIRARFKKMNLILGSPTP